MNRRTFLQFATSVVALFATTGAKPLNQKAPSPANDVWAYAESVAGQPIRQIDTTRPTPTSTFGCMVVTQSGIEKHGLGATAQEALDNALNQL